MALEHIFFQKCYFSDKESVMVTPETSHKSNQI